MKRWHNSHRTFLINAACASSRASVFALFRKVHPSNVLAVARRANHTVHCLMFHQSLSAIWWRVILATLPVARSRDGMPGSVLQAPMVVALVHRLKPWLQLCECCSWACICQAPLWWRQFLIASSIPESKMTSATPSVKRPSGGDKLTVLLITRSNAMASNAMQWQS